MRTRADAEELEERELAPCASRARRSRGRLSIEDEHPFRTAYMRDRDRIVHCAAFRRLEYKTQVFVYHEGDHYRTRLTHTLEVSQISRSVARALRLNEDLVEAIALAHDLGHPPFGHSGERALNELMADHGGFEHNLHTMRIVEHIENRYPQFRGLNLTWETRESIAKHAKAPDHPTLTEFAAFPRPSVEAPVVDLADSIAYITHDLDDGLASGLIEERALLDVALWKKGRSYAEAGGVLSPAITRYQIIRRIIDLQVGDLIRQTENNITRHNVDSPDRARALAAPVADFSLDANRERREIKDFLMERMYRHYRVCRMEEKAYGVIARLFEAYDRRPELLPTHVRKNLATVEKKRLICDYLAGMTDKYAMEEYQKLFDPVARV
ncbi:MAG: deoxyguanosinetriphosphate triphosphohydrolase [Nitrospinae bacterium]|nr:deoxyguanosinetriphosphate triphosphohydrolase [Nitrospinota bacterium]